MNDEWLSNLTKPFGCFTGIGSRTIPENIKETLKSFVEFMTSLGFTYRSGGADGSDKASESGVVNNRKEIYLPWKGFNGSDSKLYKLEDSEETIKIASENHPAYEYLRPPVKKLMNRSVYQILGFDLNAPSMFVICYTKDGCESHLTRTSKTGGTGLAISVASKLGIPIYNLGNEERLKWVLDLIKGKNMKIVNKYLKLKGKDEEFLTPSLSLLYAKKLVGIMDAVQLISLHMNNKNKILVYTDLDADGVTSAAVIHKVFKMLKYDNVDFLVNERKYGNGINATTIEYVKANPCSLIITADHGTGNESFISTLDRMGIDTIITDHHTLKDGTPPKSADVFINPQQEEDDYFKTLSGCAVAYLLCYNLLKYYNIPIEEDNPLLGLVAISTIGDMMDMSNPINRALTKAGLEQLNNSLFGTRLCIHLKMKMIRSRDVSFLIVTLINCASRMDDSHAAYRLLIADNIDTIDHELEYSTTLNNARKVRQTALLNNANRQVDKSKRSNTILLEDAEGINGIISSQVGNNTHKPTVTFVFSKTKDTCSGSGRAIIPDLNIKECFEWINKTDDSVFAVGNDGKKFGGHRGAAGCEVMKNKVDRFKELFEEYVSTNCELVTPTYDDAIDITHMTDIEIEFASLVRLEPFGREWSTPLLKVKPDVIRNITSFNFGNSKIVNFEGIIDGGKIMFTKFYGADDDVEVKDKTFIGQIQHNNYKNKLMFDIIDLF